MQGSLRKKIDESCFLLSVPLLERMNKYTALGTFCSFNDERGNIRTYKTSCPLNLAVIYTGRIRAFAFFLIRGEKCVLRGLT